MRICPITSEPADTLACLDCRTRECKRGSVKPPAIPRPNPDPTEYVYGKKTVRFFAGRYETSDSLAVLMEVKRGEEWEKEPEIVTVDLGWAVGYDEAFVNVNAYPKLDKLFRETGLANPTGLYLTSGASKFPLMRFDLDKIPAN